MPREVLYHLTGHAERLAVTGMEGSKTQAHLRAEGANVSDRCLRWQSRNRRPSPRLVLEVRSDFAHPAIPRRPMARTDASRPVW